jgi:predicted membrane-bound mannosyltransferase
MPTSTTDEPPHRDGDVTEPQAGGAGTTPRICTGCGGRNPPDAMVCDWCQRPLGSTSTLWRPTPWQLVSAVLLLGLGAALAALVVLNAGRDLTAARPAATATPVATVRVLPTAAVTAQATAAATATPGVAATPVPRGGVPPPEPTATPVPRAARIANTGGLGVNVRTQPGQTAAVGTLREGARVELTGLEQTIAARLWREIAVPETGLRGWVLSDFLTASP